MTHQDFLIKLNKIVPKRSYKILSRYESAKTKIYIQDEFGILLVDVRTLYRGTNIFNTRSAVNKTDYIINKFIKIHKDKYDYSLVEYKNDSTKVKIICPKHGIFECKPNNHLNSKGCPECGKISVSQKQSQNPSGWSCSNWVTSSKSSKKFDSFKVYIVKLYSNNEKFYKIGRTYTTIEDRLKVIPYKYEVLKVFEGSAKEIIKLESSLHKLNNKFKYTPKKHFSGENECFNKYLAFK